MYRDIVCMIADSKVSSVTVIAHLPGNIYLYFGKLKENFRVCEKNVKKEQNRCHEMPALSG